MAASNSRPTSQTNFLTREEFQLFERNVQSTLTTLTQGLQSLDHKLEAIATKGTDWKAILSGLGVAATIIGLIGSIIAWGLIDKIEAIDERGRLHIASPGHPEERIATAHLQSELKAVEKTLDRALEGGAAREARLDTLEAEAAVVKENLRAHKEEQFRRTTRVYANDPNK